MHPIVKAYWLRSIALKIAARPRMEKHRAYFEGYAARKLEWVAELIRG